MDQIQSLAAQEAQRLQTPGQQQLAMQEIHNELHNMNPGQALEFARSLNQDLGGRSPVHERAEVVQGPNGPQRTGNEVLTMADPYRQGQERIEKQIRHEYLGQNGYVPGQPGIPGQPGGPGPERMPYPGGQVQRPGTWAPGFDQMGADRAADHVAQELRQAQQYQNPQLARQAMMELRQDVYQMNPHAAREFAHRLNQDLGGNSPLHERPEMTQDQYGRQVPDGNEVLTMTDTSGREHVVKQIRGGYGAQIGLNGQPGYEGQPTGYPQPGYPGQPGYQPGYQSGYIPGQGDVGSGPNAYAAGGYEQPVPYYTSAPALSLSLNFGRQPMFFPRRPRW